MMSLGQPWALLLLPLPLLVWWLAPPHRDRVPALRFPFFRKITEVAGAELTLRAFLQERLRQLLGDANFIDALPGHLPGDPASQSRLPILLGRIRAIVEV